MSDKKLLEEQTIRRFMKLANIDGLADSFVQENSGVIKEGKSGKGMERREVSMSTEKRGAYSSGKMHEMQDEEENISAQMPMSEEELDSPEGMGGEGGGNEELFKKVVGAVAEVMGVDASVEGDEGGMGGDEEDMIGDLEMGDEEGEEEGGEEGEEEEEEGEEEEEEGKQAVAEAVLARVKARLIAEAKAAKMKGMKGMKGKGKIAAKKAAMGAKMEEAAKGSHSTGKAAAMNFGIKGGGKKGVGNVAKSSAKKGNMTPAKKSSKHTK